MNKKKKERLALLFWGLHESKLLSEKFKQQGKEGLIDVLPALFGAQIVMEVLFTDNKQNTKQLVSLLEALNKKAKREEARPNVRL